MRADAWLVHRMESPWAGQGCGLGRRQIFDAAGRLVTSTFQEAVIRRC